MNNFIEQYIGDCGFNLSDNVWCHRIERMFYKPVWCHIVDLVYIKELKEPDN